MERGEDVARANERPVPSRFEPFDLSIELAGHRYLARVTASPVGARQPMEVDFSGLEPPALRSADSEAVEVLAVRSDEPAEVGRDLRRPRGDRDALRARGEKLFRAIFTGEVGECFRQSIERQRQSEESGLLIRLHFDSAPELAALPWEALWDPKPRAFLADLPDLPVSRGLTVPTKDRIPGPARPPLHLMALLPEPPGDAELTGTAEWAAIGERLSSLVESGQVVAERIEPPSLSALGRRLRDVPCDVLHIVAHGGAGDPGAGGSLRLEDDSGEVDHVSGSDLARAFERRRPPRLIVLSACHGARSRSDDAFDGLAQHLLSRGVAAVVAMRSSISDAAAAAFASFLYEELAAGRTVEAAMVEARRYLALGQHRAEWAMPVLYLRRANVPVFDTGEIVVGIAESPDPAPRRRKGVWLIGALLALGIAGWLGVGSVSEDRASGARSLVAPVETADMDAAMPLFRATCPSPPGLQDLTFVLIEADTLEFEARPLTVERAFCISTKEVTRRDWLEVMSGELGRAERPDDAPATDLTIRDARLFTDKLDDRDPGVDYRLPTPDEWELAARGGQTTPYFFGDDESRLHLYANCRNGINNDGHEEVASVGTFESNLFGLFDVHGNVSEWVEWPDPESGHPRSEGVEMGEDGYWRKFHPRKGDDLALRLGGNYTNSVKNCAFGGRWPDVKLEDQRPETGFRVVRSVAASPE